MKKKLIALTAATALALTGAAATVTMAEAASKPKIVKWTKADRKALANVNLNCASVEEDVQYEWCVFGGLVLETGHPLTSKNYGYGDDGQIVLVGKGWVRR